MSESMVERVARVLWDIQYPEGTSWDDWADHKRRNPDSFDGRDTSRKLARAAIEAMLEPNDEGLDAFAMAFGWQPMSAAGRENARHAWRAMITVALGRTG